MRMTDMVKHLLIINIIFFVGSYLVPNSFDLLALHYFESDKFQLWQPITSMFMHGGIGHIFFNMFALVSFGSALEQLWGGKKFLFFYFSCGIGAALLHTVVNYYEIHHILNFVDHLNLSTAEIHKLLNIDYSSLFDDNGVMVKGEISSILDRVNANQEDFNYIVKAASIAGISAVGASGAIYGLLVAFAYLFPDAELALMFIPVPIKAKYFVPGLLAIDLFLGLKGNSLFGSGGTGIAHFAHLGGAIIGLIIIWYWKKNQFNKHRWDR
ncbi:rhomboid family intramembrane serine protease [Flavobacterium sp. HNIBRBA15423]|uniref:rhomboid family intramembrane serine protease n=1 Tax=Flavobacterium sp. HNIBRBA15423 TaxID=3458683 RepID=UPI0040440A05